MRNDPATLRYIGGSSVVTGSVVTASQKLFDSVDGVTAAPTVESAPPMAKTRVTPAIPNDEPLVKESWRDQLPWLAPAP